MNTGNPSCPIAAAPSFTPKSCTLISYAPAGRYRQAQIAAASNSCCSTALSAPYRLKACLSDWVTMHCTSTFIARLLERITDRMLPGCRTIRVCRISITGRIGLTISGV